MDTKGLDTSKDNTTEAIKKTVEQEFKNIDTFKGDDDQEIHRAGINICQQYIDTLRKEGGDDRALEPFLNLQSELKNKMDEIKNLGWFDSLTLDQKQEIYEVAQKIDNAENEVLKRLQKSRAIKAHTKLVTNTETQGKKPVFKVDQYTGIITFTKESNPIPIHQALEDLFKKNPNQRYIIDYSQCESNSYKGKRIKEKMTNLIETDICYLCYDQAKDTYVIRDKDGNPRGDRALIWEGVNLIPDEVNQWEAYQKKQTQNKKLGTFDVNENSDQSPEKDPQFKNMIAQIPSGLRSKLQSLGNEEYRKFIIATENRLATLLRDAKSQSYELATEPITKTRFTSGLMELHLVSGDHEKNITIWDSDNHGELGDNLYDILDDNDFESDYKSYLTDRVSAKREEFEGLTKNQLLNLNTKEGETGIDDITKSNILNGLRLWNTTIENYRNSEGNSWLDNDDKKLVAMTQLIRDAQYTLKENSSISLEAIQNTIITPLRKKWKNFNYEIDQWTQEHKQTFQNIFLGTPDQQIQAIRKTCDYVEITDHTETSHLANEIAMEDIHLNDTTLNGYFQNIKNKLEIKEDDPEAAEKKDLIDDLYDTAKNDKDGTDILGFLTSEEVKLLPKSWATDPDVKKKAFEIGKALRKNQEKMDALTEDAIMERQEQLRGELEAKADKTEEEIIMLQGLTFFSKNPDIAKKEYATTIVKEKDEIKYGGINELFIKSFITTFVDKADGVKGTNADILNDIVGVGRFDLSDENAKFAGELLVDIAITIAVSLATMGTGSVATATLLRGSAYLAKGIKATKLLQKIEKTIQTLSKLKSAKTLKQTFNVYKNATLGEKATLLGITASEKVLEAPIFNAASATLNAAIHGTSLDSLNLNPLAKENLKTAAFLGALSLGNKLGMGMIGKLHGAHKLVAFSKAGLNDVLKNYKGMWTESLISEATAMFGAEQGMNFVFGHDVIDPVTGEVETTRSLQRPTEGERVQMIGMILAFKAFKPQLWAKYEKKLNDGTLQVCRSTNKNEVLLRDPKTGKTENIQHLIDHQYNNYRPTPEQYKLRNHNKRVETQSKYKLQVLEAQEAIAKIPENKCSETMKVLLNAKDIVNLSPNDIKRVQREIGFTGTDVDGIMGPKTVEQLTIYLNSENYVSLHKTAAIHSKDIKSAQQQINELNSRIQANEALHSSSNPDLEAKRNSLNRKQQELQDLQTKWQRIKEAGGNIDYSTDGIQTEITRREGEITKLIEEIQKSEQTLQALEKSRKSLSDQVQDLTTTTEGLSGEIFQLQELLNQAKTPKNIVNREFLANSLSEQRFSTENANNASITFTINENYIGEIRSGNSGKNLIIKKADGTIYKEIERSPAQEYRDIINAHKDSSNPDKVTAEGDKLLREKDAQLAEDIALELPDPALDFSIKKEDGTPIRIGEATKSEAERMQQSHQDLELYQMSDGSWGVRKISEAETTLLSQIQEKQTTLAQKQQELNQKRGELNQKNTALERQRNTLSAKKKELDILGTDKKNLEERAQLEQQIRDKTQEIQDLQREINAETHLGETVYTSTKKELDLALKQAQKALEQAQKDLADTQNAIDNLSIGLPEGEVRRPATTAESNAAERKKQTKSSESIPETPKPQESQEQNQAEYTNKQIEALKQEIQNLKENYTKITKKLTEQFPESQEMITSFNKTLESKTTLEDINQARYEFSTKLIKTLQPGMIVRLSHTSIGTTDYRVEKDAKGNLTFTHAKEKLSVKDLQDIMKKKEIEINRKAERAASQEGHSNDKSSIDQKSTVFSAEKQAFQTEKLKYYDAITKLKDQFPDYNDSFEVFTSELFDPHSTKEQIETAWNDLTTMLIKSLEPGYILKEKGLFGTKWTVKIDKDSLQFVDKNGKSLSTKKLQEMMKNGNIKVERKKIQTSESKDGTKGSKQINGNEKTKKGELRNFDYEKYKNEYPELLEGVTIGKATYKLILDENNVMKIERTRGSKKLLITEFDKDYIDRIKTYKEAFEKRASELQSQLLNATATKETYQSQLNSIRSQLSEIKQQIDGFSALQTQFDQKQTALQNFRRQQFTQAKGKKLRLNGDERHCKGMKENGTLQFKKYDNNENFTISSFADFSKNLIKINGERYQLSRISDRSTVQQKERKAGGRTISQYEQENINFWREAIQQEQTLLQDFNTAKQALSPLKGLQEQRSQLEDQYKTTEKQLNQQNTIIEDINQQLQDLNVEPEVLDQAA